MKRFLLSGLAVAVALGAFAPPARADFASCVGSLRAQATHSGISAKTLDVAFNGLEPDPKVLDLQKQQPEFKTPIWDYVDGLDDDQRVADGKAAMAREGRALARAEEQYGVSRTMLAAIWGVESNFGQEMGKRPLVQSLTTLACMGDRASYFRSELMATLKIIDHGDVPPEKLTGSWAGAFGQTQFMPSTFLRLAVDFEGDGRRDIVDSAPDALASTANYLVKSGWRRGLAWGFEVKLPPGYSGPSGRKARQSMSFWASHGLARIDGRPLGEGDAALLLPAGREGPAFLVTRNFEVVYSYNAAESYTLAACVLSDRLGGGRGIVTPWPTDDPLLSRDGRKELQALLQRRGYDIGGDPDGHVGTKSKAAIADFQQRSGLEVNGRPSVKVLAALKR
ncbi:MAG TPA: lytic murein transglycosylase [Roseiarcus sp.]|nr:lytic murein transglycosylase [Roseiarcus sp.]